MTCISRHGAVALVLVLTVGIGGAVGSVSAQQASSSTGLVNAEDVEPSAEAVAEIAVDSDTVPDSVSAGESFDVTMTVRNVGDADADTGGIEFSTPSGISADNVFLLNGIDAGEEVTRTVTFDVNSSIAPDRYTATAEASVGDSTDSADIPISIGQPVAEIAVDSDTVPDSVSAGESFDVTMTVRNVGDADADTGGIEFSTPSGVSADSVFLLNGVDAGEEITRTVTFDVNSSIAPDRYTATAEATVGESTDSADIPISIGQPVAEIAVASGPTPDPSAPGESFDVEFAITNTGEADAPSGGIEFDTPRGVSAQSIFLIDGIDAGERVVETVTFDIEESAEPDEYTATANATVGESTDSVDVRFEIAEDEGLSRFDTNGNGEIDFAEVVAAIAANNDGETIGNEPVSFSTVIEVITAHNEETPI